MLEAETLTVERLKEAIPGVQIFSAGNASASAGKALPCIVVGLIGFDPVPGTGAMLTRLTTEIMAVALVRNVTTESAAEKASPLLRQIFAALKTWSPGAGYSGLRFTGGGTPDYDTPGIAAFPLTFTCEQQI